MRYLKCLSSQKMTFKDTGTIPLWMNGKFTCMGACMLLHIVKFEENDDKPIN